MWVALRSLIFWSFVCGFGYPLLMTGLCQMLFPFQANGSVLGKNEGSVWIAQEFSGDEYFWSRPSHTGETLWDVDPSASSGSNWGPREPKLIEARRQAERSRGQQAPEDLLSASGSGLDPHISVAGAFHQIPRVAKARGLSDARLEGLVQSLIEPPWMGCLGSPRVNVLLLNRALEGLQ